MAKRANVLLAETRRTIVVTRGQQTMERVSSTFRISLRR